MIRVDELQPGNVVYLGSRSPSNVIYVSAPLESGQGVTFMNGRRVPSPEHQNSRKIIKVLMLSTSGLCPIIPHPPARRNAMNICSQLIDKPLCQPYDNG